MMKRMYRAVGIILGGLVFVIVIRYFGRNLPAPHYMSSSSETVGIQGNLYRISDVESELRAIAEGVNDRITVKDLTCVQYSLNADKTGFVYFCFQCEEPGDTYSRIWERIMAKKLSGVLEIWGDLPEGTIYRVNYRYGEIPEGVGVPILPELKDTDILDYYEALSGDTGDLASADEVQDTIDIILNHDGIAAIPGGLEGQRERRPSPAE